MRSKGVDGAGCIDRRFIDRSDPSLIDDRLYNTPPSPNPNQRTKPTTITITAITGYDIDVVQRLPDGREVSVPSRDYYCHHYILGLRSALYRPPAGMEEGEGDEAESERRQHARAHDHAPPPPKEAEAEVEQRQRQHHRFPLPSSGRGEASPTLLRGKERQRQRRPLPVAMAGNASVPEGEEEEEEEELPPLRWASAAISEAAETIPLIQTFCEGA
jgi:hypothetical protein